MSSLSIALGGMVRVARRFGRDACAGRAAGLAFSTLFALVPLTAVVVALLSAFDVFQPVIAESQQMLLQELVPGVSDQVFESLGRFSENARTLGLFGFGLFVVTATALLRGIHTSINAIWRFRSRSGFWRKFSTYTTVIVVGTALLAAAVVAGPNVRGLLAGGAPLGGWLERVAGVLVPPALLFGALFLMIILVPSGRVEPASAVIGALVAAIAWEIAKRVFVFWTARVMRLSLIYGSLAAVPIFLIWLYITWLIVLAGVEVAYVHQHRNEPVDAGGADQPPAPLVELSDYAVRALAAVFVRFRDGLAPLAQHDLDERYGAASGEAVRDALVSSGLVLATDRGLVPARSLAGITVEDVVTGLWAAAPAPAPAGDSGDTAADGTGAPPARERSAAAEFLASWCAAPDQPALEALTAAVST